MIVQETADGGVEVSAMDPAEAMLSDSTSPKLIIPAKKQKAGDSTRPFAELNVLISNYS